MKKGAIIRLIIWSVISILLIAALIIGMLANGRINIANGGGDWFIGISGGTYPNADEYIVYSDPVDIGDKISDINIEWESGNISIETYEGDTIRIEENPTEDERLRLRYRVKNGTLDIKFRNSGFLFGFGITSHKNLTLKIPADFNADMNEISVTGASAPIEIKNISTEKLDIETVSGAVTLESCKGLSLDIDSVSGDITAKSAQFDDVSSTTVSGKIDFDGSLKYFEGDTTSGNIKVSSITAPDRVESDSISGNFTLTIPENDGFTVEFDSVSGTFDCGFETVRNKDEYIYKNGNAEYQFDTVSGDISINKK